jgi:hypothetical protein
MSQTLGNVPFPPAGFAFVDKRGALTASSTSFLRSLWARTGYAIGGVPESQLGIKTGSILLGTVPAFGTGGAAIGGAALIASGASGAGVVTFPTAFMRAFIVLVSASAPLLSVGATSAGLTGFSYAWQSLNTAPAAYSIQWLAIET